MILVFFLSFLTIITYLSYNKEYYNAYNLESFDDYSSWMNFEGIGNIRDVAIYIQFETNSLSYNFNFIATKNLTHLYIGPPKIADYCNVTFKIYDFEGERKVEYIIYNSTHIPLNFTPSQNQKLILSNVDCPLKYKIPNGRFRIIFANNSKSEDIMLSKLSLYFSFNRTEYGCRPYCIVSDKLILTDVNEKNTLYLASMKGENLTGEINLEFRTYAQEKLLWSNILLSIFTGLIVSLIMFIIQIIYDFSRNR